MKKIILIASLFIINIGAGKSQDTDNRQKFEFEIKAGGNYSNVYDASGDKFVADSKFGFAGGVDIKIPLGKYFGIQPEALISQKGFKASGSLLFSDYNFTRTTTYLDIPIQFAFKPIDFITILAGPQYSYLLNQKDVFSSTAASYSQEQQFKQDNIRKNIFGAVVGFDINLRHITLGARAGWDIQNNNGDGSSTTPRYKNLWYQATIGFALFR